MGTTLEKEIHELSKQAPGRCTTCLHSLSWDVPDETRHWCRAFGCALDDKVRLAVRDCPRWRPFAPYPVHRDMSGVDPGISEMIEAEDLLFWRAKQAAKAQGLCLKTLVAVAHPGASAASGDLDWIDDLDDRFQGLENPTVDEATSELRAYGYISLAAMIETANGKSVFPTSPPVPSSG